MIKEGFAVTGGEDSDDAVMYVAESNKWKQLTRLLKVLIKRDWHGSVFLKNLLFVFGGSINGIESSSVHYLDESGSWHVVPQLPNRVNFPEVVSTDNYDVFLMDTFFTNKLYKMDVETKLWVSKARLPGDVSKGARTIYAKDRLYVVGGKKKIIAWYIPSTDSWLHGAKHQHLHFYGAVMHQKNTILLVGGES